MALGGVRILITIIALALGALLGEEAGLDAKLEQVAKALQRRFRGDGHFITGFMTASLVYCVGAMAVMGALQDGLTGDYEVLLAKSALDGITAIVFASTFGPGVAFSVLPVLVYQGSISLAARALEPLLEAGLVADMTCVGGLLIAVIGLNLLGVTRVKVANLLPAIFMVIPLHVVFSWAGRLAR
jgi:uncharacterized membrane protein YqgA involved in biofilm formation